MKIKTQHYTSRPSIIQSSFFALHIRFGFLSSACRAATCDAFGKDGDKGKSPRETSGSLKSCPMMAVSLAIDFGVDTAMAAVAFSRLICKSSLGEAMPNSIRQVLVGDSNGEGLFAPGMAGVELNDTRITFPYASNLLVSLQNSKA